MLGTVCHKANMRVPVDLLVLERPPGTGAGLALPDPMLGTDPGTSGGQSSFEEPAALTGCPAAPGSRALAGGATTALQGDAWVRGFGEGGDNDAIPWSLNPGLGAFTLGLSEQFERCFRRDRGARRK